MQLADSASPCDRPSVCGRFFIVYATENNLSADTRKRDHDNRATHLIKINYHSFERESNELI